VYISECTTNPYVYTIHVPVMFVKVYFSNESLHTNTSKQMHYYYFLIIFLFSYYVFLLFFLIFSTIISSMHNYVMLVLKT